MGYALSRVNVARIEKKLFVVSDVVGVSAYDFNFDLHFACDHPYRVEGESLCILRIGPIDDYAAEFREKLDMGLRLVNSPDEHSRASELEHWYPYLEGLTPRTQVFDALPHVEEIEQDFQWPVFMKGSRQTSKHNPDLSVIQSREHYALVSEKYRNDPILHWQKPVIREFVPLMPVEGSVPGKVKPSMEYRSFWWHGKCVGWGRYWYQVAPYHCADVDAGLEVARQAAARLDVPFLVVDFAKTANGRWIVIECNDAQESGYAGIPPQVLWQNVLAQFLSPCQR
ncbi:ATP-grasp domain-containing protein [Pseudoduganella sp. R-34]|uniref:ATP-grasp domain-containing protein n=1 Tax=unclassified Pseudoduganella TaxID=2637179 RepID=UPI003CF26E8B